MAETPTKSQRWTIFWAVVITLAVIALLYFLMKLHKKMFSYNQSTINSLIAALVAAPPNPFPAGMTTVTATSILQAQVQELCCNQDIMKTIYNYAQLSGQTVEQVLVNEAYVQCHQLNWL
jgi:hypothetical protein